MTYPLDIPLCESFDEFAWDPQEVRDLIPMTPSRFEQNGYDAGQPFGRDGACFARHFG